LELVALDQSVMHPRFQQMALTSPAGPVPALGEGDLSTDGDSKASIELFPRRPLATAHGMQANGQGDDIVRSLAARAAARCCSSLAVAWSPLSTQK
jgi:hypothetical protein